MLYALLRAVAGVALRWYYRRIDVEGLERVPHASPLLVVVNHPNALVDALLVAWSLPRPVVLTAKATLFENGFLARFLGWVGVVPLVRSSDVRDGSSAGLLNPGRNARAFDALRSVLRRNGAIVIFPEGLSHDNPYLAPLKTGAARIALDARDGAGIRDLHILPVGLMFERKDAPRSRVLVRIGDPIAVDWWHADRDSGVSELTAEIDARLRRVTLNYESSDDASRAAALAALFAAILRDQPDPLSTPLSLSLEISLAARVERVRRALSVTNDDHLRARVDRLLQELAAFDDSLRRHQVALEDVVVSSDGRYAIPFVLRECAILAVTEPFALWGAINHWVPFHAARLIARRSVQSASDPAMRTIVAGTALVVAFYTAQGLAVGLLAGWITGVLYVASLPVAADINFLLAERRRRTIERARTYLRFRARPRLQARLQSELLRLREEAMEVEAVVLHHTRRQAVM